MYYEIYFFVITFFLSITSKKYNNRLQYHCLHTQAKRNIVKKFNFCVIIINHLVFQVSLNYIISTINNSILRT